jgi:hypothetical protein
MMVRDSHHRITLGEKGLDRGAIFTTRFCFKESSAGAAIRYRDLWGRRGIDFEINSFVYFEAFDIWWRSGEVDMTGSPA